MAAGSLSTSSVEASPSLTEGGANILAYQENTNPGTTDFLAALNRAVASLSVTDPNLHGVGGPEIFFPAGKYYFSGSINLKKGVTIRGVGGGMAAGQGTIFYFAPNVHGIIVNATDTDFGVASAPGTSGAPSFLNLQLMGSGTQEKHGIFARGRFYSHNVSIQGFGGCGIDVQAGAGIGDGRGNANGFRIEGGRIFGNRKSGIRLWGGDVNTGRISDVDLVGNADWGIENAAFLGNLIMSCHTSDNGMVGVAGRTKPAAVTHNGKVWTVAYGQDALASTQAPGMGGAWRQQINGDLLGGIPAWVSGTKYKAGGAYLMATDAGYGNLLLNCYSEGGQPQTQINGPGLALWGTHGAGVSGAFLIGNQGRILSTVGIVAEQLLNGEMGAASFGGFIGNDEIFRFEHPTRSPVAFRYRLDGNGLIGPSSGNNTPAYRVTLTNGPWTFGRGLTQVSKLQAPEIFLGDADNSRAMTMGPAAPTTGSHAKGEVVWNDGTNPANDAVDYWRCTRSGTPGIWVKRP